MKSKRQLIVAALAFLTCCCVCPGSGFRTPTPSSPFGHPSPTRVPNATAAMETQISTYFLETDEILIGCMVELSNVQELLDAYARNPAIYYSQDWYDAMEWHILGWFDCTDKLQNYGPIPRPVKAHHEELLLMVAEHDKAQDYLLAWIDTPDSNLLLAALAQIESANARFERLRISREELGY